MLQKSQTCINSYLRNLFLIFIGFHKFFITWYTIFIVLIVFSYFQLKFEKRLKKYFTIIILLSKSLFLCKTKLLFQAMTKINFYACFS